MSDPGADAGYGQGALLDGIAFVIAGGRGAVLFKLVAAAVVGVALSVIRSVEARWATAERACAGAVSTVFRRHSRDMTAP